MRSSAAVLTTVTHCCLALPTNSWSDYSQFRMQLPVWWLVHDALRSYHSGAEGPPLAASPAAHTVQNGDAGAQVPKWTCAGISHHRLLLGCSRRSGTRSAGRQMLKVVRMNTSFGDRSFAAAAPRVWNSLPDAVRISAVSEDAFCETVEDVPDELYVGRGAFDVELAPLNKLIIIIIIAYQNY